MKVTQEKLPASQIGLEIEITPEMSKQAYEKAVQNFTRSANIPGFRKGKVPRQVLIQRFGATRLKATVIEELIEQSLKKAVEQEKIDAIGSFELRSSFEELVDRFEPGAALTFSAAVDVPPDVKLSQYTGLQVQAEEVKYDAERVDKVLENQRNQAATLVPVEERPAQIGDVAVVDFSGQFTSENGGLEDIQGGSAQDFQIDLEEGKFIPGFIDGIVGMESGATKEVAVVFPEDYPQADLAGKPAVFTITLKELKERELPELDDDFAQDVSEFETLAELRESLESRFKQEAESKTKANKEQALLDELVKHIEVELPETLVKQEADYMLTQTAMQLSQQGLDVKQMFTPDVVEQLRGRSRPEAIIRIQRTLALGEVAQQESIKVEPQELEARVQELMTEYKGQDVDPDRLRQVVEEDLLKEKILDWLEEHGTVELVPEGSLAAAQPIDVEAIAEATPKTVDIDPATATIDTLAEAMISEAAVEDSIPSSEIANEQIADLKATSLETNDLSQEEDELSRQEDERSSSESTEEE
jgi:trigger factor